MERGTVKPHEAESFAEEAREKGGNVILVQGKSTCLHRKPKYAKLVKPKRRGTIKTFSAASRRKLLGIIARMDWDKLPKGAFITLTYPDQVANVKMDQTTDQRNHFILKLERHLSEELLIVWRKEIQPRKSGKYKKLGVQHFHLCVFTTQHIECWRINQWWRDCIGWPYEIQCHRKVMEGWHAAMYMAKYLTKDEKQSGILEDVSYLNKPGRMWGWRREERIPWMPLEYWLNLSDAEYQHVMEQAICLCPKAAEFGLESFTMFGRGSDEARKIIAEVLS